MISQSEMEKVLKMLKREEKMLHKVDPQISREYGEGITIIGDCPKHKTCAHLKWTLCPGWHLDCPPCKNLDQDMSSFDCCQGHAVTPVIEIFCKKRSKRKEE